MLCWLRTRLCPPWWTVKQFFCWSFFIHILKLQILIMYFLDLSGWKLQLIEYFFRNAKTLHLVFHYPQAIQLISTSYPQTRAPKKAKISALCLKNSGCHPISRICPQKMYAGHIHLLELSAIAGSKIENQHIEATQITAAQTLCALPEYPAKCATKPTSRWNNLPPAWSLTNTSWHQGILPNSRTLEKKPLLWTH